MKKVLDQWKKDYWIWMYQKTVDKWHGTSPQDWHQIERKAFRTHLWEIIGCYEMTRVFLYAPFNRKNLTIFKNRWRARVMEANEQDFVKNVVEAISSQSSQRRARVIGVLG